MCWSTLLHPFKSFEMRCKDCLISGWDGVTIQSFHLLAPEFSFFRVFFHINSLKWIAKKTGSQSTCASDREWIYVQILLFPSPFCPCGFCLLTFFFWYSCISLCHSETFFCCCLAFVWGVFVGPFQLRIFGDSVIFCLPPSPPKLCLLTISSPFQFVNFFLCFFLPGTSSPFLYPFLTLWILISSLFEILSYLMFNRATEDVLSQMGRSCGSFLPIWALPCLGCCCWAVPPAGY